MKVLSNGTKLAMSINDIDIDKMIKTVDCLTLAENGIAILSIFTVKVSDIRNIGKGKEIPYKKSCKILLKHNISEHLANTKKAADAHIGKPIMLAMSAYNSEVPFKIDFDWQDTIDNIRSIKGALIGFSAAEAHSKHLESSIDKNLIDLANKGRGKEAIKENETIDFNSEIYLCAIQLTECVHIQAFIRDIKDLSRLKDSFDATLNPEDIARDEALGNVATSSANEIIGD